MANVKFGRGSKAIDAVDQDMVYFNIDTQEIYMGGKSYGFSSEAKADLNDVLAGLRSDLNGAIKGVAYNEAEGKFTFSFVKEDATTQEITIAVATASSANPGLMSQAHVNSLTDAVEDLAILMGTDEGSIAKDIEDAVTIEANRAKAAEEANTAAIEAEAASARAAEKKLGEDLTAEAERADLAEKANAAAIVTEKERAEAKEAEIAASVVTEKERAEAAEKVLTDDLAAEVERAGLAEQANANAIDAEVKRAKAAEEANTEAIAILNGDANTDGSVAKAVAAEAEAREGADQDIMDLIGAVTEGKTVVEMIQAAATGGAEGAEGALTSAKAYTDDEIKKLDATVGSQEVAEGKHVAVEVVEVDGMLTAVTVVESDIASAAVLASVKEDVDLFFKDASFAENAKDTLKELQEYITSDVAGAEAMAESIADNKTAIESEATTARAAEAELEAAIALLNNTGETVGSVAHSVAAGVTAAKDYTDEVMTWYEDEAEG